MTEMREWWANVYQKAGHMGPEADLGIMFRSRESAIRYAHENARFRIHVRLKPEGAPKRYAGDMSRKMWEMDPRGMRAAQEEMSDYLLGARARWSPYLTRGLP